MPAAFTTVSHATAPASVSTPVTRPSSRMIPVTVTPSRIVAPAIRAAFA